MLPLGRIVGGCAVCRLLVVFGRVVTYTRPRTFAGLAESALDADSPQLHTGM